MRRYAAAVLLSVAVLPATPAMAQEIDARVGRLESEMRAVQRKVFPGGAGQYVQPDIAPDRTAPDRAPGTPASSPVADLTQRVSSLEGQLQSLTGQIEQNQYRIRQLEDQFNAYRRATDARLAGTAQGAGPGPGPGYGPSAPTGAADRPPPGDDDTPPPAATGSRSGAGPAAGGDPARSTRAAAVEKPDTGVPDEDAYLYGYRLWQAKLYPEAETQLKQVVADYPKSKRASYAQNLLGRSYLDDGKANSAATAFYESYKKFPDGERAPDSLYYLATTLMKLNKPADACKVYGELTDVYGAKITPAMKADVAKGRVTAKCS
ncbi:YbgF trimerization domain-containing protein [uncultured Sphingomonas sp.]|uniref:YbgF trimerization domain-containing protein n=1 Tax=uncultured Sphingomonas sp. TaxID=158754 RepID=UPI0035CACC55